MGIKRLKVAVTTEEVIEKYINAIVIYTLKLQSLSNTIILPYMPSSKGYNGKYLLKLLIAVKGLNRATKATLIKELNYNAGAVIKGIDYLFEVGYIRKFGKPRLIVPFQKFKIDTGYVITPLGESVLRKIIIESMG